MLGDRGFGRQEPAPEGGLCAGVVAPLVGAPADISNAIKFLKDNHIDAMPVQGSPLDGLLNSLPFNSEGILDALAH